jgi:hypothetical protein
MLKRCEWAVGLIRVRGCGFSCPRIVAIGGGVEDEGVPPAGQGFARKKEGSNYQHHQDALKFQASSPPVNSDTTGKCQSVTCHCGLIRMGDEQGWIRDNIRIG